MERDESEPVEDALDPWLLAYEESGGLPDADSPPTADAIPAPLRDRFVEAVNCLQLLDQTLGGRTSLQADRKTTDRAEQPGDGSQGESGAAAPEAATVAAPDGPLRLGKFEIVRELGRGGFGIVFLAVDAIMHREVALKVPLPAMLLTRELRRRWLREAEAVASLDHPSVVPAYEAGEIGPVCYIASAYCKGPTLAAWLRNQTSGVAPQTAAQLVAMLADAVEHAHRRGILHRDIKPSNVLLVRNDQGSEMRHERSGIRDEGSAHTSADPPHLEPASSFIAKLTDFGLAKLLEQTDLGDATRAGVILGTPRYMAPEQAAGRREEVGPATDVYALGAILYELLTGRPPLEGASDPETLRLVQEAEMDRLLWFHSRRTVRPSRSEATTRSSGYGDHARPLSYRKPRDMRPRPGASPSSQTIVFWLPPVMTRRFDSGTGRPARNWRV